MKKRTYRAVGVVSLAFLPLASLADIVISATGVEMSPPSVAGDFFSMEARIVGAEGTVYNDTSFGETLHWTCGDCADGGYSVETRTAVLVGEAQTDEGPKPVLRVTKIETARFTAQAGALTAAKGGHAGTEAVPWWWRLAAGLQWLLDRLVPNAQAVDLTASSSVPSVGFDDSTSSYVGTEFWLACEGGVGATPDTDHDCYFYDAENVNYMWWLDSGPNLVRMGIGTSAPSVALHIATPQTPRILLDSASTDFRIGGSDDIEFTITNNAFGPTGVPLTIENDFFGGAYPGVGIWQQNPTAPLEVGSHDGEHAQLVVRNAVAPAAAGDVGMFRLTNPGPKTVRFVISANGQEWTFDNNPGVNPGAGVNAGQFRISKVGTGVPEFTVNGFGDGAFVGNSYAVQHINTSSREVKAGFAPVDSKAVLERVAMLPITTWHYRTETPGAVHLGPVAEDFQQRFGLGDGKHISTVDQGGVALAAIQGLYQRQQQKEAEIEALKAENQALKAENRAMKRGMEAFAARLEALEGQSRLIPPSQ
jgi:hypothetical protein